MSELETTNWIMNDYYVKYQMIDSENQTSV